MKDKDIFSAMEEKTPVYFVDIKKFNVKKPDEKQKNQNKDPNALPRIKEDLIYVDKPVVYTMPVVARMYITDYNPLRKEVKGIWPIDFRDPEDSESYIDYGKRNPKRLYKTADGARQNITPELIKQFLKEEFVQKHPQMAQVHPILAEIFDLSGEKIEEVKEAALEEEELIDD